MTFNFIFAWVAEDTIKYCLVTYTWVTFCKNIAYPSFSFNSPNSLLHYNAWHLGPKVNYTVCKVMLYFNVVMIFSFPVWVIQIWRLTDCCFRLCHHCVVSHILSCILSLGMNLQCITTNNNKLLLHAMCCTLSLYSSDLIPSQIPLIYMSTLTINQSTNERSAIIIVSPSTASTCTLI